MLRSDGTDTDEEVYIEMYQQQHIRISILLRINLTF